jgi:hypothetical protein
VSSSTSRSASRSGPSHSSCSSGRSGSGNVSATGPGPNTGPVARAEAVVIGLLWSRSMRSAPSTAHSMSCGPPKIDSARRASRTSARRCRHRKRMTAPRSLHDPGVPVERQAGAGDLTADEGLGATLHDGDREPIGTSGDRVRGEEHPAEHRVHVALDQDRERRGPRGRRGPRCGTSHGADGVEEGLPAVDVDHRLEHAGLGRCLGVLRGGRGPDDDRRAALAAERAPGRPQALHHGGAVGARRR